MKHSRLHGKGGCDVVRLAFVLCGMQCVALTTIRNAIGNHTNAALNTSRNATHSLADSAHNVEGECIRVGPEYEYYCGTPVNTGLPQPIQFRKALFKKEQYGGGICSQLWQDWILAEIFLKIGTTNRYFVEFGARVPQTLNSAHFRLNCGWSGLLMDGAPGLSPNGGCPGCADVYDLLNAPDKAPVRLRQAFITQENVNDVFAKMRVPHSFDLLTVDIDGNDYWVLKGLNFDSFSPRVVAVEFSSYFSKDQPYVQKYNPKHIWTPPHVVGASLVALDGLLKSRGYSYVAQVGGEHAIWVLDSLLHKDDRGGKPIPDRVNEGWQVGGYYKADDFERVDPYAMRARRGGSSQQAMWIESNGSTETRGDERR